MINTCAVISVLATPLHVCISSNVVAPLGGPKGRQAEPHRHHAKAKETHELIFSWLSWLAVLLLGAYTRRRRELPNMAAIVQKKTYSLGLPCTSLMLDIHAMINWHLSKQDIRWPVSHDHIAGSSLHLIEVACFWEVDHWPGASFSIGSRAHFKLTCWKQGRIVRKPV